jgi:phospholipase/carboxylesterase
VHRSFPCAHYIKNSLFKGRVNSQGLSEANRQTPIFAAHGTEDDVVSLALGEQAVELLRAMGLEPEWRTYDMPHSVCLDEVAEIANWLRRVDLQAR